LKILLTNDDGIEAPGLWAAALALRDLGEVFVVAPDKEQSGVGTSITLRSPICVCSIDTEHYLTNGEINANQVTAHIVKGTPGDSCILGLERIAGEVDLVVSGINAGSNLGWDIAVSGTVGAAMQGYVRGFPTIAISVGSMRQPRFQAAAQLLRLIGPRLVARTSASNILLNINVPNLPLNQIKGIQVTRLGNRAYGESVRQDNSGPNQRYWINRDVPIPAEQPEGTDIWAMKNAHISITPLRFGLADLKQIPEVERLLNDIPISLLNIGH
jgi:5'-nucleotidase